MADIHSLSFLRRVLWFDAATCLAPNTLGTAVVIVQAVAVGVIAELQVLGLRRGAARPASA